ncbi:uncharacterized protein TRIVIDRAFT_61867 [Trichoderma virens Gv29-8]|uniref:Tri-helical domain-containing protein n=1 Tax=Hypocrea virens (strain Gv29-8 / FGSC 10586) TaxID=413071 RepID=G9MI36_HYPVG|nr:uncharacterized protein TRIVIDRAFT_61867 [Trichoderma virens Gv29-8]EHK25153.1 hypothetical protein TRIVIDRAFT_61867 [Trichoderma virens Gv29-8]
MDRPDDNLQLLGRIRNLWEQNMSRPKMTLLLQEEGFQVTQKAVTKLCSTNGLRMHNRTKSRSSQGYGSRSSYSSTTLLGHEAMPPPRAASARSNHSDQPELARGTSSATGTRRNGIKKTAARAGARQPSLYDELSTHSDYLESQQKLDTICQNVAKSKRFEDSKMTQLEVKNTLGLNPEEVWDVRDALSALLRNHGFDNKFNATPTLDEWKNLMLFWGERCPKISNALGVTRLNLDGTNGDEGDTSKIKRALYVLSRDVLKRLRDDRPSRQAKKQPPESNTPDSDQNRLSTESLGHTDALNNTLADGPTNESNESATAPDQPVAASSSAQDTPVGQQQIMPWTQQQIPGLFEGSNVLPDEVTAYQPLHLQADTRIRLQIDPLMIQSVDSPLSEPFLANFVFSPSPALQVSILSGIAMIYQRTMVGLLQAVGKLINMGGLKVRRFLGNFGGRYQEIRTDTALCHYRQGLALGILYA